MIQTKPSWKFFIWVENLIKAKRNYLQIKLDVIIQITKTLGCFMNLYEIFDNSDDNRCVIIEGYKELRTSWIH